MFHGLVSFHDLSYQQREIYRDDEMVIVCNFPAHQCTIQAPRQFCLDVHVLVDIMHAI